MDTLHATLIGAIGVLSAAIAALWRHGNNRSRAEEALQTEISHLLADKEKILANSDLALKRETKRTAEAVQERRDTLAFIVPILTGDRLHLEPQEMEALQQIMKGHD